MPYEFVCLFGNWMQLLPNKALVRTFTTLRFVHAAQLGRWTNK